jgi:dUTP pyrophosphatase
MKLNIKKLHPEAKLPEYAHSTDSGMDLFALNNKIIKSGEIAHIETGIAIDLPRGYVALVWDKGSIGMIHGLKTLGGVFDAGYTGDYTIGLVNLNNKIYKIEKGSKIAQLLIQKVEHPKIIEVKELKKSKRGSGRFGSTGKK